VRVGCYDQRGRVTLPRFTSDVRVMCGDVQSHEGAVDVVYSSASGFSGDEAGDDGRAFVRQWVSRAMRQVMTGARLF